MKRLMFVLFLLVSIYLNIAYAGLITPFSENNAIDIINGEVWVATHLRGPHMTKKGYIYRFNLAKNNWKLHSFPSPILCIGHADSIVWLGTYGGGILKFENDKWERFTKFNTGSGNIGQRDGLISNYVNTVVVDEQNIYCATVGGLSIYSITQNKWTSFDSKNSPLPTSYIFNLEKKEEKIWLANSNYWYVYYEQYPMDNEKGGITSFDIKTKKWKTFSGMRREYESDTSFIELKGDIPVSNSNFSNVTIDDLGNLWFAFQGGVGIYRNGIWKIYSKATSGIDFGHVNDMAAGKLGVWVACEKGLLEYREGKDTWVIHQKESNKIPGSVIRSIYVANNFVWIKSYDPNFWENQGLSADPLHGKRLREKSEFYRLTIDGSIVDIKCQDKNKWKELYNPGYMEFLTVYESGKWKSWELTRMLIEELTK